MIQFRRFALLSIASSLFLVYGCHDEAKKEPESKPSATTSTTGSAGTPESKPTDRPSGTTPSATTANLSEIPADLKHEGFTYYGLGNSKPMNMEIRVSDDKTVRTGTQTITYEGMLDGKPTFLIERTGQLDGLGKQEVRLEKDGIYNSSSTLAKVGTKDLEMPANLAPGSTWPSHVEVDQASQKMVSDSTYKVERTEKVTTKGGEHEALLITSTGKGTFNGQAVTITSKSWYVKDLGGVKTVLTTTYPDGKVQTITIEETK